MTSIARLCAFAFAACALLLSPWARATESNEFRISRQPSILYLQQVLMEDGKLVEKHAATMGLRDLNVRWVNLTSGGVSTDALLAGQLDIVTSGMSNLLLAWGKTNGQIKGVSAVAGLPILLVTRSANVKSLGDFGPNDRIGIPTLKVSIQATILGIALDKLYGPGGHTKLDANYVQLGHPDAAAAVLNPMHEVNSHFAPPPYAAMELKAPGAHSVLNSIDALGGPATITGSFAAEKFVEANPIKIRAYLAAMDEASDAIKNDPGAAADVYLRVTKEKISKEELVRDMTTPGAIFSATPQRTQLYADYMYRVGLIRLQAKSWKDYFIAPLHGRDGS